VQEVPSRVADLAVRAGDHLFLPRCAGHRPSRPEGRGFLREVW
jgi:hypothetical protein